MNERADIRRGKHCQECNAPIGKTAGSPVSCLACQARRRNPLTDKLRRAAFTGQRINRLKTKE